MKPHITLPKSAVESDTERINTNNNNVVIIGANGSGKTRLGAWIEKTPQENLIVHRISAQRALIIPDYVTIKSLEQAEKSLLFGRDDEHGHIGQKRQARWGNAPETHLLEDFQHLLSTLFARTTKLDREHSEETKAREVYIPVVDSPIDIIVRLWKDIMSQRDISFEDGKVLLKNIGQSNYHGKGMSDGERVTLYLVGQCLCAPINSIIIIDEPEIHLHRSLMVRLWDKIEEECPNKLLVYITHDLDFAASRNGAKKIWVKDYNGKEKWNWEEVPEIDTLPENLVLEIIGNRKNILFCEGEKVSYDTILYQAAFPDHYIIPRGGCQKVIDSTKAMRANPSLHHLKAFGIIDRDYRTEEEIVKLKVAGIYTINVAEIENLFCIEPIIRIVADTLGLDADEVVEKVTEFVINSLKIEFDDQVTNRAEREIQFRLKTYTKKGNTEQGLNDGINSLLNSIDVNAIYSKSKTLYQQAIDEKNLDTALKIYNRKNLHKQISPLFGLSGSGIAPIVLRLLKGDKKADIISAIQGFTSQLGPVFH